MRNVSLFVLISVFMISSCYKDNFDDTEVTTITPEPEVLVDANLVGEVKDFDDERLLAYAIKVNDDEYTPKNGLIELYLDRVNELSQSVYIETQDGRDAFTNLPMLRNEINYTEIYLFPKRNLITLDNNEERLIDIENNIQVAINNGQFPSTSAGEDIIIAYRSLIDQKLTRQIGNRAYDRESIESVLDIDQAFELDWSLSSNTAIELKPGESVSLSVNNLSNIARKALFRYDAEEELWIFTADIDARDNILSISEKGFYAVADYYPAVVAKSRLVMDMKPVAYQSLKIETSADDMELYARTTSEGNWISLVPKSENLNIQVENMCQEIISEYSLTSNEEDEYFAEQQLTDVQNHFVNLNTTIINCDGELQENAVITIQESGESNTYVFEDEHPDVWISSCAENVNIFATDNETGETGPSIEWNTNIDDDLTFLSNCKEFQDGFSYLKIRDDKKLFEPFTFGFDGNRTILTSQDGSIKFSFKGASAKRYSESEVNIFIEDASFGDKGYFISCENSNVGCGINDCSVTHYAEMDGDWMRVSFSGTLWMQTIEPPIAGNYHVEGLIMAKK